jgi:hypothetical protein
VEQEQLEHQQEVVVVIQYFQLLLPQLAAVVEALVAVLVLELVARQVEEVQVLVLLPEAVQGQLQHPEQQVLPVVLVLALPD